MVGVGRGSWVWAPVAAAPHAAGRVVRVKPRRGREPWPGPEPQGTAGCSSMARRHRPPLARAPRAEATVPWQEAASARLSTGPPRPGPPAACLTLPGQAAAPAASEGWGAGRSVGVCVHTRTQATWKDAGAPREVWERPCPLPAEQGAPCPQPPRPPRHSRGRLLGQAPPPSPSFMVPLERCPLLVPTCSGHCGRIFCHLSWKFPSLRS